MQDATAPPDWPPTTSRDGAATRSRATASRAPYLSLTYVSACAIDPGNFRGEVGALLDDARRFNLAHGITGALVFTGSRFVQTLEGRARVVDQLTQRIAADPRHARLEIVDRRALDDRRFATWSMAYAGPSLYVARVVDRALDQWRGGDPRAVAQLLTLMLEFAREP